MARQDIRMLAKEVQEIKEQLSADSGFFSGDHEDRLKDLEARLSRIEKNLIDRNNYKATIKEILGRIGQLEAK